MRILQVIESFGGGSMQIVLTISERLAADGHEVAIAHGQVAESPVDARAAVAPAVALHPIAWGRAPGVQLGAARALRAIVRRERPDVVHLHSSFAGFVGAAALRGLAPLVYTPHGYSFIRAGQSRVAVNALRLVEGAVARRVDVVGVVSEAEAERAREIRAPRVVVVPNGITDLDAPPGSAHRDGEPVRVVALGRLDPARQPLAAGRILADLRDLAAVEWIGGGDSAVAAELRHAGVPVSGWLERPQALTHLAQASAALHWSAWDAQPLSVLEAMSRDVVVVASDIAANRELLGPQQVCDDEAQATQLLRRVLSEPSLRAQMLDEQRRRRAGYSARRMVSDWERVYGRVMRGEATGSMTR